MWQGTIILYLSFTWYLVFSCPPICRNAPPPNAEPGVRLSTWTSSFRKPSPALAGAVDNTQASIGVFLSPTVTAAGDACSLFCKDCNPSLVISLVLSSDLDLC